MPDDPVVVEEPEVEPEAEEEGDDEKETQPIEVPRKPDDEK